jgi:cyanate lyase
MIGSDHRTGKDTIVTIVPLPPLGRREAAAAALAAKRRPEVSWQKVAETLDRSLVWSELSFERREDPAGDGVRLVLDGSSSLFLPYRVF